VTLLRLGRNDEAFAVADAARSRGLLEHLAAVRDAGPASDLVRGEALLRRIDELMRRIRESEPSRPLERSLATDTIAAILGQQLAEARGEYEALVTRTPVEATRSVSVLGAGATRLADVRGTLDEDEVLLEYLVTSERLIVFVLRRNDFRVIEEPLDAITLRHRIELVRDVWRDANTGWRLGLPAARALYGTLIGGLQRSQLLEGATRILVVPHGVLGQLPFAALQDPATRRYLVEDYSVSHLPSAMALAALRRTPATDALTRSPGEALAPFPAQLPATRSEVLAFRDARPGAKFRLGAEASEAAVRLALTRDEPVHVATHGTLNVRNPMFSRIELAAPARQSGPANDGRLEVHELLGLRIRSPLVFLSGCETGAGQAWSDDPVRGTADLTLAQAALSAGAGNVVSTLWRIQDAGAATFAGRFYTHLQRGSVSAALALAQRDMIADSTLASPYYWAGYILSGEGRFGGSTQIAGTRSVPQKRTATLAGTPPGKVQ
jgi:CHAT domain-containing protein